MRLGRSLVALSLGTALLAAAQAQAQRVALVRPDSDDPVLRDAFNRLTAELRLHHFEPAEVEPEAQARDPDALALAAKAADALACIAFIRHGGKRSVEVWLADRVSGKITMRTLELSEQSDASSVLAIRAVDLLRASLREFDVEHGPPSDVAGVDRRPVPEAAKSFAASERPGWKLRLEALLLADGGDFGLGYGPSIGLARRTGERFELGLAVAGPILGASFATSDGSASLRQELGWLELRVHVLQTRRLELGANAALGEHYLNAQGRPLPPALPRSDHVLSWLGALGVHAELALLDRVALTFSARALFPTPLPAVGIRKTSETFALPLFYLSTGVALGL